MAEHDYRRQVTDIPTTRFLDGTTVEVVREVSLNEPPQFALFDFDGTLSLVREGWPEVMVPMFVDILRETGTDESEQSLSNLVMSFVMELTGKQTIYQMMRLSEEIEKRGGQPDDPSVYKQQYHDKLMERIHGRRESLRNGTVPADDMLVPYSIPLLDALMEHNVQLYLASGTDEVYVREEAAILGLEKYFGEHIYGAHDDVKLFSKQMVIQKLLADNKVEGSRLIGFGDGYVEIDNVKTEGGTAIAVASDESGRSGKPDPWKRDRLIGIGADVVIPDFRDWEALLKYLGLE